MTKKAPWSARWRRRRRLLRPRYQGRKGFERGALGEETKPVQSEIQGHRRALRVREHRHRLKAVSDVFSKQKRSSVMAAIPSRGNESTEIRFARLLRALGMSGWRRNQPIFGRPDFVFRAQRVAVFVDGCFWHGCPVHGTLPKQNARFWQEKINTNMKRDRLVERTLRLRNWMVLRVWEHDLRKSELDRLARRLRSALSTRQPRKRMAR